MKAAAHIKVVATMKEKGPHNPRRKNLGSFLNGILSFTRRELNKRSMTGETATRCSGLWGEESCMRRINLLHPNRSKEEGSRRQK